jgi:Cu(I)/Ag(I) efflux system protein CusF
MKLHYAVLALPAMLAMAVPAAAQMQGMPGMQASETKSAVHKGQGTINRVDQASGKINLTHGPIKSLGWAGMTMDFPVKDKAMLSGLKPGQRVEFELEKVATGEYPITHIRVIK